MCKHWIDINSRTFDNKLQYWIELYRVKLFYKIGGSGGIAKYCVAGLPNIEEVLLQNWLLRLTFKISFDEISVSNYILNLFGSKSQS